MCLAVPALVTALLPEDRATVSLGGVTSTCSLELVDGVAVGDYVIVHVGYALSRLDAEEAERTLALLAEVAHVEAEAAA
jgi:hydrogenase expression/formation protein HypC